MIIVNRKGPGLAALLGNLLDHSWLELDSLSLCSGTSMLWIDLMLMMVIWLVLMILSMMMILSMLMISSMMMILLMLMISSMMIISSMMMILPILMILQGPLYSGPAFEMPLQRARGAAEGD